MKVKLSFEDSGAIARLTIDAGKGNIIDRACVRDLGDVHREAVAGASVRAVILDHEGPHFSYGASVEEHKPGVVQEMLPELHSLVREFIESPVPLIGAVRGMCLGGGLEVALCCTRIFAAPDAKLGQPEVKLGVFAPVASVLLPLRVGDTRAAGILLSGEIVVAETARAMGLVDEIAEDPRAEALAWVRTHLVPSSAIAIRFAHRAVRRRVVEAVRRDLPVLERAYLTELMATSDASEGIASFIERRPPVWKHA